MLENGTLDRYQEIRILLCLWYDRKRFPIYHRHQHHLIVEMVVSEEDHEIRQEDFVYSTGTDVSWLNLQLELLVADAELMQLGYLLMQEQQTKHVSEGYIVQPD